MKFFKALVILFALIGLSATAYFAYDFFSRANATPSIPGEQLNEDSKYQNSINSGVTENNIAIPTLNQGAGIPQIELVDCWKTASDGSYQYNFGQISRDECEAKVKSLQQDWEKTFTETVDKQKEMNENSSLIVPENLIPTQ